MYVITASTIRVSAHAARNMHQDMHSIAATCQMNFSRLAVSYGHGRSLLQVTSALVGYQQGVYLAVSFMKALRIKYFKKNLLGLDSLKSAFANDCLDNTSQGGFCL